MKFSVFQLSRRGGRATNEDRMGYCYTREAGLFLLADGMGGHAEGEVAAQIALQTVAAQFQQEAQPTLADIPAFLASSLLAAHRQILRYAQQKRMRDTPRTTLVAAVIQDGHATWVHCGDSRLYWVRQGQLLQRTHDHSFAEMARNGMALADERMVNRNVLFTCLGAAQRPVFDIEGPHRLEEGDRLLLCSDGLWDVLPEAQLLRVLCGGPLNGAVPSLVEAALLAAGRHSDNVTALAMEWQELQDRLPQPAGEADQQDEGDSVILSTISGSGPGMGGIEPDLDVAEMERAIAEINAAIRRTPPGKA